MATNSPTTEAPALPNFSSLRIGFGVVCIALGIAVLAWPVVTLLVVALIFGIQLVVAGAVRIVLASKTVDPAGGRRTFTLILGVLTVVAGVICIVHPGTSLLVIAWCVAGGWLLDGISEFVSGLGAAKTGLQRVTLIFFGVTSVVGALLIITFPGASLLLFNQIGGLLLLILGVIALGTAIRARRTGKTAATR